jgi:hypothetical protein
MLNLQIPGQMKEAELCLLQDLAKEVPRDGTVVEVGSLYGLSAYTWATSADPSVTVYCIDPWVREQWIIDLVEKANPGCREFSLEAFLHYTQNQPNIIPLQGFSPGDFQNWNRPVDIFFDDALHHNPPFRKNLRFWLSRMRPGGIMCGHDYCKEWPDVMKEVDALARELGVEVQTRDWVWWFKLPAQLPHPVARWFRKVL